MEKNCDKGISRRSALKRMGLLMAGAVALGMPTLASCSGDKKKRIILYFTATGNSLYVARQLADEIGIVYPIYGQMPPNMVRRFIQKARLKAAYKFAVLTYGRRKCNAVGIWDEITQRAGCPFDYITTMIMVDNWLPNFDMADIWSIT